MTFKVVYVMQKKTTVGCYIFLLIPKEICWAPWKSMRQHHCWLSILFLRSKFVIPEARLFAKTCKANLQPRNTSASHQVERMCSVCSASHAWLHLSVRWASQAATTGRNRRV